MKTKLLVGMLLAGSALFAAPRVSIGIGVGGYGYVPPPVYAPYPVYTAPYPVYAAPYPGYTWVDGYWYYAGPRRLWRAGYWAPRAYYGQSYYGRGYGGGYRGVVRYYGRGRR
jgi:hypothetical protein